MKLKPEEMQITFQVKGPRRGGLRYRLAVLLVAAASRLLRYRIEPIAPERKGPAQFEKLPHEWGPSPAYPAFAALARPKSPDAAPPLIERGRSPLRQARDPASPGPKPPASPAPPPSRPTQLDVHFHNADGTPAKSDGEFIFREPDGCYRITCKRCGRPARDYFCFTDEWPPTCAGCRTQTTTPTNKGGTD